MEWKGSSLHHVDAWRCWCLWPRFWFSSSGQPAGSCRVCLFVCLFRRPIFAVLDAVFNEGQNLHPDEVFHLSPQGINELSVLMVLGPVIQTEMRVGICPELFMMDASPSGDAICRTMLTALAIGKLWRHSEQRGCYTKCSFEHEELFGAATISAEGFGCSAPVTSVNLGHVPELQYDCIELFSGQGNWSRCHAEWAWTSILVLSATPLVWSSATCLITRPSCIWLIWLNMGVSMSGMPDRLAGPLGPFGGPAYVISGTQLASWLTTRWRRNKPCWQWELLFCSSWLSWQDVIFLANSPVRRWCLSYIFFECFWS